MNVENKYNINLRQEMKPIPHAKYAIITRKLNSFYFRMSMTVKIVHEPEIPAVPTTSPFDTSFIDSDISFFVIEE